MDEVLRDWKRLSLIGKEGERVILKKSLFSSSNEHVLVARFMTRKPLMWKQWVELLNHFGGLRWILTQWRLAIMFFKFIFELETDAERVLATKLWSFNKHLVLFQRHDFSISTGKEGERVILKKSHFSSSNEHVLAARFMTRKPLMWKQWVELLNHFGGLERILRQGRLAIMFFYLFSN